MRQLVELDIKIIGCPIWVEVDDPNKAIRVEWELGILFENFYGKDFFRKHRQ